MNWYLLISLSVLCLAHYCHSHSHSHEPPAYKYSQAANAKPDPAAHHGHSHDHHGHSHDHHGHSHDHHGHSHDHHGHSHDHHGHSHDHHGHSHDKPQPSQESSASAASASHVSAPPGGANHWMEAILATVLISIAPVFILLLVPLENTEAHEPTLKVLLSFASGGLLGDAFLHLIPHAMDPHVVDQHSGDQQHHHEHGHSHDHTGHMRIGLWVVAGILAFLLVEKVIRFLKSEAGISHSHSHSHSVSAMPAPAPAAVAPSSTSSSSQTSEKSKKGGKSSTGDEASFRQRGVSSTSSSSDTVAQKAPKVKKASSEDAAAPPAVVIVPNADIKVAGYLNLAADFAHNFTDGLAIGASFLMGRGIGMVTTVTILFHEVPHEIGDFAILLQSGCSKKKAILLQLSTALGALLGTTVSLIAGASAQTSAATSWIMPFTAGGFIYIATVAVIPDLLRDTAPCQSVKEIIALLCGVGMMLVIGFYE